MVRSKEGKFPIDDLDSHIKTALKLVESVAEKVEIYTHSKVIWDVRRTYR